MERISAVRNDLKTLFGEGLDICLKRLGDEISPESHRYDVFIQIKSRYSAYLSLTIIGGTAQKELDQTYNALTASLLTFINTLQEQDLKPVQPGQAKSGGKRGELLYNIPHRMQENREHRCAVRVAYLEETLFEGWKPGAEDVRRNIRIAEIMAVEMLNVGGDQPFAIRPVTETVQFLETGEVTEWIFYIRPLMRGEFPLLLKVSVIEVINGREAKKDVVIEEHVIVSNAAEETTAFKKAGVEMDFTAAAPRERPIADLPKRAANRGLRALAIFLAFLVGAPSATWALTPPATWDYGIARLKDTPEAYDDYIKKYDGTESPHLQKTYIRKAEKTEAPQDYRRYLTTFGQQAEFKTEAVQALKTLENKQIQAISKNPDTLRVRRFFIDFPESERLPEVKQAVETRASAPVKEVLLPEIKTASLRSLQLAPTTQKVRQIITTYPDSRIQVKKTVDTAPPEVKTEALPVIEQAYVEAVRTEPEPKKAEETVREYIKEFTLPQRSGAILPACLQELKKVVEEKPALRKRLSSDLKKAEERVKAMAKQTPSEAVTGTQQTTRNEGATANPSLPTSDSANNQSRSEMPDMTAMEKRILCYEVQNLTRQEISEKTNLSLFIVNKYRRNIMAKLGVTTVSGMTKIAIERNLCRDQQPAAYNASLSGFEMVPVAGGTYTMGQPDPNISCTGCSSKECPHEVTVRSFEIGKYEVTQADWRAVMGSDPPELSFKGCDDCPVERVSWDDVKEFLRKANAKYPGKNYRLPSEEEWEFAARGGNRSKGYTYAGSNNAGKVAWYDGNSGSKTHPVGALQGNELGLFDMSGNVYEWCADTWGPYSCDNKTEKGNSRRVVRGGSWLNGTVNCRATYRGGDLTDVRLNFFGFRLAR